MRLRSALNVIAVVLWVLSQTTMTFAHSPNYGQASDGLHQTVTGDGISVASDCGLHAVLQSDLSSGGHHHEPTDSNHNHQDSGDCCSATCSFIASLNFAGTETDQRSRNLNGLRILSLTAAELGLPTPPPDTVI